MSEQMQPIHPAYGALLSGKTPEPCEPFVEISCKVLTRLLDIVEFGDQLERVEKDNLLSSMKELLAMEQPELWVIHSVGPGELHPMISKEAADSQAAELAEVFKEHVGKMGLRFDVIRSPFTPLEHFETLAEEVTERRDNLLVHCNALEKKLAEAQAPAVVNQQVTTAAIAPDELEQARRHLSNAIEDAEDGKTAAALPALREAAHFLAQAAASTVKDSLSVAARDVLAERQRQITAEGWTPSHDDRHVGGELADAAACYALWGGGCVPHHWMNFWPFVNNPKLAPARRLLIKAGALILAEIDRLDRAEEAKQQEQQP